ncbi:unnamed protein product, partial [Ectocarpus sp. 12 AP-2014]
MSFCVYRPWHSTALTKKNKWEHHLTPNNQGKSRGSSMWMVGSTKEGTRQLEHTCKKIPSFRSRTPDLREHGRNKQLTNLVSPATGIATSPLRGVDDVHPVSPKPNYTKLRLHNMHTKCSYHKAARYRVTFRMRCSLKSQEKAENQNLPDSKPKQTNKKSAHRAHS